MYNKVHTKLSHSVKQTFTELGGGGGEEVEFMGPITYFMRQLAEGEIIFTLAQSLLKMLQNQDES